MQCDIYSLLYPLHFTVQALYSAVFLRFLCTFALWSILFYFLNIMKVELEVYQGQLKYSLFLSDLLQDFSKYF